MPIEQGNYLLQYKEKYNPKNERGWALCDSKLKRHYTTPVSRKGRTLIECLESAKQNGHKLYLCRDLPRNIKNIKFENKRKGQTYSKHNQKFKDKFNVALLLLSQLDFSRNMLQRALDRNTSFIFDPKLKTETAYVINVFGEMGKEYRVVFSKDFESSLELAKIIVHELHHSEQTYRDYEQPEMKHNQVWDLQSYLFLTRVFEAEALVAETHFLDGIRRKDNKGLLCNLSCEEKRDKDTRFVYEYSPSQTLQEIFADCFVASFPSICNDYDKISIIRIRDLIYWSINALKDKKITVFSIHPGNVNKEVYSNISVAGISFGRELKAMGIDLLDKKFFGIDENTREIERFVRKAQTLSEHFNEKSFTTVFRNKLAFKRYMTRFINQFKPNEQAKRRSRQSKPNSFKLR